MTTRVVVEVRDGRHVVRTSPGALRAQRLHGPDDRARVALVGRTALLLGGDVVELDVEVGPGARLELADIAATVAYHGRGRPAVWRTRIRVASGASLRYAGQPLIVSDGAEVTRSLTVDLDTGATAALRETVVFGRSGQDGGRLDAQTVLSRAGVEFLRERLRTDAVSRALPGVLGGVTVTDTVLALGCPGPSLGPVAEGPGLTRFQLLDPGSTMTRYLGRSAAESPLAGW